MFRGNNRHPSSACGYFLSFVLSSSVLAASLHSALKLRFYERLRIELSEPARSEHSWGPRYPVLWLIG
ncbi:uncharacterized protein BDW70DRAFT_107469 [Aspergillus foveolatus]|uniref:uncharacterized protein n=1 Tax=Aspergillus foveolatus TaxID=210207 RepID=UPI003CCCF002